MAEVAPMATGIGLAAAVEAVLPGSEKTAT
jgi:hypothetical protein